MTHYAPRRSDSTASRLLSHGVPGFAGDFGLSGGADILVCHQWWYSTVDSSAPPEETGDHYIARGRQDYLPHQIFMRSRKFGHTLPYSRRQRFERVAFTRYTFGFYKE